MMHSQNIILREGLEVPQWKMQLDPQWWTDYLQELNIDQKNS